MELYKTVRAEAEASQTIERSKFTAHVKPVESREEAEEFIAQIKAQYRDATHNVPAMVLGDQAQIQWASDDGEPQGTSGAPMVQLMTGEGLTNMVIVVTRYFGGIKLGTGGLVRAYSSSARLGIEAAGICDPGSGGGRGRCDIHAGQPDLRHCRNSGDGICAGAGVIRRKNLLKIFCRFSGTKLLTEGVVSCIFYNCAGCEDGTSWRGSTVEQLICNQQVGGSIPSASSKIY